MLNFNSLTMKKMYRVLMFSSLLLIGGIGVVSCSLDPKLENNVDNKLNPIKSLAELQAGITGSYSRMLDPTYYGRDIIIFSESRTPYCYSTGKTGRFGDISGFSLQTGNAYPKETWRQIYRTISNTNRVILADLASDKGVVDFIKGQGYIIRALGHYDLLRIYGEQYVGNAGLKAKGVPYIVDFANDKAKVKRETVEDNMKKIMADLDKGISLMETSSYKSSSKSIINIAAAYAFKSRIALFFAHYDNSMYNVVGEAATAAIDKSASMAVTVVGRNGFLDTYKSEAATVNSIFEFAQSGVNNNGTNSLFNIYNLTEDRGGYGDVVWNGSSKEIIFPIVENKMNVRDIRSEIVNKDYQSVLRNTGKYTNMSSNVKMIRIEEMYFNYIEAALKGANTANRGTALKYLNEIVSQRVLLVNPAVTNDAGKPKMYDILTFDILKTERTKELMFEGFGYEDLMRWEGSVTNPRIKASTNPHIKGEVVEYGNVLTAFPIPDAEINVSKIEQNQGYK